MTSRQLPSCGTCPAGACTPSCPWLARDRGKAQRLKQVSIASRVAHPFLRVVPPRMDGPAWARSGWQLLRVFAANSQQRCVVLCGERGNGSCRFMMTLLEQHALVGWFGDGFFPPLMSPRSLSGTRAVWWWALVDGGLRRLGRVCVRVPMLHYSPSQLLCCCRWPCLGW